MSNPQPPHNPPEPHTNSVWSHMNSLRASVLGANDGIVSVAGLVVPALGDYCLIDELTPDGTLRRVESTHADASRMEKTREELQAKIQSLPSDLR